MYHGLKARVLVTVLMLALALKPCLGLLVHDAGTKLPQDIAAVELVASVAKATDSSKPCKRKCLASRPEEVVLAALSPLVKASGQPGLLAPHAVVHPRTFQVPVPASSTQQIDARKRLALLNRLLL